MSLVVSIARFATRAAYVIVDPPLVYPPPTGVEAHFQYKQHGVWHGVGQPIVQFGSGFAVYGTHVALPITALRYFPVTFDWPNVEGRSLLEFNLPVPYPP